ncbi:replication factor C subunit 1 [Tribolium madens]|uniref:replication factor C subunit 1 n=1 Tax=Tribolium madens TaxID=41895 RepID=UPI001CF73177|nr:replication factor C subunit 1 [Tribolium madens]
MSKDIRSFFTVIRKKSDANSPKVDSPAIKKKPQRIIESDDEDVVSATPETKQKKLPKRREVLNSDSDEDAKKAPKKVKTEEPKLKPVNVAEVFKNVPIKQSKVDVPKTPVKIDEKEIHKNSAFNKTLEDLDDDIFEQSIDLIDSIEGTLRNEKKSDSEQPQQSVKKRSRNDSSSDNQTPKKKKIEHSDSGIDPGQEAYEKKRYSAMLYQKYLNRGEPKHRGIKELPKGKPDCLKNLCFLKTGVLDSLDSEGFANLVKQHGGRVVNAVSRKVNYVVVGEEPGPAKLAKADGYNIPNISEDELLDMILTKSGIEPKYCKKNTSCNSEDLGIDIDNEPKPITHNEEIIKSDKSENKKKEETETSVTVSTNGLSEKKIKSDTFYSQPSTSKISESSKVKTVSPPSEVEALQLSLPEKYKPQNLKGVIGQQGESSNLFKLKNWLINWHRNQDPKVRKKLPRPTPWTTNDNGAYFKCALLSGPPGVGKTTTATLVAKDLGLDIVEFNASDTRSKKLLHEEVSQLLSTKTIAGFATGNATVHRNRVLLMDEVDGMAGNEDRGGIQELIQLIKNSNVPIICMCNDRNHQKIRSLVNYCYDLKFTKPKLEQIKGSMMSICCKEGIDISSQALTEIIVGTGCDVRQTLNHLALLGATKNEITFAVAEKEAKASKKDSVMGPWEVCRTVFTKSEHKNMSVVDRARLFFFDYSLGPLFVQENYLKVQPEGSEKQALIKAALAADSISMGDIIDSKIRRSNNWALLDSQAFFSSVIPGYYMSGDFQSKINFPSWLGKNSKKNKFKRLISELQLHTRTSASATKLAVMLDYLVPLRNAILSPLQEKGLEGVNEAVAVMKDYNLLREDVDSLLELCQWSTKENPMNSIDSKVKSAFTRAYNKQVTLLPFAPASGISKKKIAALESDLIDEDDEISDNEDDDDISNNAMIKVKKKPAARGKKADEGGKATSKNEKKGKGKAKKK